MNEFVFSSLHRLDISAVADWILDIQSFHPLALRRSLYLTFSG